MVAKGVMNVERGTAKMKDTIMEMTLTDYTTSNTNSRPEGITEQDEEDEEDEMLAKFWADYGESLYVDPMEQEWMWDEKNFN